MRVLSDGDECLLNETFAEEECVRRVLHGAGDSYPLNVFIFL